MNLFIFALLLAVLSISSLLLLYTFKAERKIDGNHKKTNWQHGAKVKIVSLDKPSSMKADAKALSSN